jgi:tRNA pseudouridine38-40 synthase
VRTLKLTISYDGTRFVGWQYQAEGQSIQGVLEEVLARIEGAPVSVQGAGRTDAGVHALAQVASVRLASPLDLATLGRALNAQLPGDIRVTAVEEAAPGFHARFSATSKTYRYQVRNAPIVSPFERAYVWHVPERLDAAAMAGAARTLVGTHDFAAFRSTGSATTSTIRTMTRSTIDCDTSGLITYEIAGDGFLRHMVRAVVGTLVDVGRGWREPASVQALLETGHRGQAGPTAPPHGLFLVRVDYDR